MFEYMMLCVYSLREVLDENEKMMTSVPNWKTRVLELGNTQSDCTIRFMVFDCLSDQSTVYEDDTRPYYRIFHLNDNGKSSERKPGRANGKPSTIHSLVRDLHTNSLRESGHELVLNPQRAHHSLSQCVITVCDDFHTTDRPALKLYCFCTLWKKHYSELSDGN